METDNDLKDLLTQHITNDKNRLDRIESKIDKLSDTVVALARAEEKLIGLEAHRHQSEKRFEDIEEDIDEAWKRIRVLDQTVGTGTRLIWIITTAVVALVLQTLLGL